MPLNHTMVKMANLMLYFTTLKKNSKSLESVTQNSNLQSELKNIAIGAPGWLSQLGS